MAVGTDDRTAALAELEDLLLALFSDGAQLIRFLRRTYGPSFVQQLPAATVPFEQLAHEATAGLDRNGHVGTSLLANIAAERPNQITRVNSAARAMGLSPVTAPIATTRRDARRGVPDHVVDDVCRSLLQQREYLREFLGGPYAAWVRASTAAVGTDNLERKQSAATLQKWIDAHVARFQVQELRDALPFLRECTATHVTGNGVLILLALADRERQKRDALHQRTIGRWINMTEGEAWSRAVALVHWPTS